MVRWCVFSVIAILVSLFWQMFLTFLTFIVVVVSGIASITFFMAIIEWAFSDYGSDDPTGHYMSNMTVMKYCWPAPIVICAVVAIVNYFEIVTIAAH